MIFFFFSLIASFAGSISSGDLFPVSFNLNLSVENSLSGIISFWPFIVALVIVLLAILWFQTIRNIRNNKNRTIQSRQRGQSVGFLAVLTVVVLILSAAPYFLRSMENNDEKGIAAENKIELFVKVQGMDCNGCEQLINRRVGQLAGVDSVSASHTREEVFVIYDRTKTTLDQISYTIEEAGYIVVNQ
jgi:copper chaperone CopZ